MRSVEVAVSELRRGKPVIVVDDAGFARIVVDAASSTAQGLAFVSQHGSGVVCAVMSAEALDALELPSQRRGQLTGRPDYAVTVDLIEGVTTGISAGDRAATLRGLANPRATAQQFCRPGHVMPVRAAAAGVLERRDGFHAALDLAVLGGASRCVGVDALIDSRGDLLAGQALAEFAAAHRIPVVTVAQVVAARRELSRRVTLQTSAHVTLADQVFRAHTFAASFENEEHTVLTLGFLGNLPPALVRTHMQCVVGALPRSQSCSCQSDLQESIDLVSRVGRGVVVILNTASTHRPVACASTDSVDGAVVSQLLDQLDVSLTAREPVRRTASRPTVEVRVDLALVG